LVGGTSGGIAGFTTCKYRVQNKDGLITVQVKVKDSFNCTKETAMMALSIARTIVDKNLRKLQASVTDYATQANLRKLQASITDYATQAKKRSIAISDIAKAKSLVAVDIAKAKSIDAMDIAKAKSLDAVNFATTTKVGVTSSSAVAGAAVGGAGGGAVGTVLGAAVGVVPAIFTFGLSIPAFALVGLCVGTTAGASTGAVGGGLVGYGGFTHREAISDSLSKVKAQAEQVKAKTIAYAADAKESAMSRVRVSTGGSEHDKSD